MATATVMISFEVASVEEASSVVNGLDLPDGASVLTSVTQGLTDASGIVEDGSIVVNEPPELVDYPTGDIPAAEPESTP